MRRPSARLVENLRPLAAAEDDILCTGRALGRVRGRPVRLRAAAFPPMTASGLWVDRTSHDLIVYEENTDPEHQLVIIGHETWHMFQGHGTSGTGHEPAASRAAETEAAGALAHLVALLSEAADTDLPAAARMDVALHFSARGGAQGIREEPEADHFGFRFATDVRAALDEVRATDPHNRAVRVRASMAHRFHRT